MLRVYDEDFKQGRAGGMFNGVPKDFIKEITKGKYNEIVYKSNKWYLSFYNDKDDKHYPSNSPFCHRVHILNAGSSFQFPEIKLILFDEFIRNENYPNEFEDFQTVLSTLIRLQTDVQIFMCGNTINSHSIYFTEFGIKNVTKIPQGQITLYQYGVSSQLALEYCGNAKKIKVNNDIYFPFKNSASQMITKGAWQLSMFPHLPCRYAPKDILLSYFIIFEENIYQCDIVNVYDEDIKDNMEFTFIHRKTTPIKNETTDIVYSVEEKGLINWSKNLLKPTLEIHNAILKYWKANKIFFQDNLVGDSISAYIRLCRG